MTDIPIAVIDDDTIYESENFVNFKLQEKDKEIEKLKKENNDLRKLYQRTYKHLFEIGNDELAYYFQTQIDECPTFYVEPVIDYCEETKRLTKELEFERQIKKEVIEYCRNDNNFQIITVEPYAHSMVKGIQRKLLAILDKAGSENNGS